MAPQLQIPDVEIASLRGGLNDTDPPVALAQDECTKAENVEFFFSMLGERRGGLSTVDLTGSSLAAQSLAAHISQWFPLNDILNPEVIAISVTLNTSVQVSKRTLGVWSDITPGDALTNTADIFLTNTQALNGKLHVAVHSAVDRLMIWDGTNWRRAGLAQPNPPTAANNGSGSFTGTRYYRVRYTRQVSGKTVTRSEPSTTLTFAPSGSGSGVTVTKPASISEGETHWELEASEDAVNFYVLATQVVATTTFTDTTAFATGYTSGTLSDAIGSYVLQPSAKYLCVDGDRLIGASHWTDNTKASMLWWTPPTTDPGVGNSERMPIVTTGGEAVTSFKNIDDMEGGPITGLASGGFGIFYIFKWDHVYKATRTLDPTNAYEVQTLSKSRGAIPGSIVRAVDEYGAPCIFFLDPMLGPSRVGLSGIEDIKGIRTTWGRVNCYAQKVITCGAWYAYKRQVMWDLSVDGQDVPSLGILLQTSELRPHKDGGLHRGWSTYTGKKASAYCMGVVNEQVIINGVTQLSTRPVVGLAGSDFFQRTDVADTDNGTAFVATIITHPYLVSGLLGKWGALNGTLLATANSGKSVNVRLIRDLGVETTAATAASLTPGASESEVIDDMDALHISEARMIQVQFSDN